MVRGGWASIRVQYEKLCTFNAYLFVDFKITIMSTGDQRGWFNSDKICEFDGGFDVSIRLGCVSLTSSARRRALMTRS